MFQCGTYAGYNCKEKNRGVYVLFVSIRGEGTNMRRVFLSAFDSCPEVVTTDKSEGHTRLKDVQTQQKNERERRKC